MEDKKGIITNLDLIFSLNEKLDIFSEKLKKIGEKQIKNFEKYKPSGIKSLNNVKPKEPKKFVFIDAGSHEIPLAMDSIYLLSALSINECGEKNFAVPQIKSTPEIKEEEENVLKKEIPKFLSDISDIIETHIVPGNHDGNIEKLLPGDVKIHGRSGFLLNKIYFNHGHSWPGKRFSKSKLLLMGHSHPAIEFKDSLGYKYIEPCWLRCKLNKNKLEKKYGKIECNEAIILPAFNPLISGMPVNRGLDKPFIGPLMRNNMINLRKADAYLLDGTYLGKVEKL